MLWEKEIKCMTSSLTFIFQKFSKHKMVSKTKFNISLMSLKDKMLKIE
jgi:hypothetical protein